MKCHNTPVLKLDFKTIGKSDLDKRYYLRSYLLQLFLGNGL